MADFCRQCARTIWGHYADGDKEYVYTRDLAGLSTEEDTARGLYPVVICEGCGVTQVDHNGECVSWDCYQRHAPKPPLHLRMYWHLKGQLASPIFRRRLLIVALVTAAAAALSGCASLQSDVEGWEATPSHKPLPAYYVTVEGHEIRARCGWAPASGAFTLHACALRRYAENECLIITEANPPAWIKEHEEKHCAGYDHPRYGS